jgi:type III restriction enzyme
MIAITNWHLLAEGDAPEDGDGLRMSKRWARQLPAHEVVAAVLPPTPGPRHGQQPGCAGPALCARQCAGVSGWLPELMVFNDEAHHIHEFKREGEVTEVEWQKSLSRIAEPKGRRFVQVDFSATPYNDVGSGKNKKKLYFPAHRDRL